MFIEHLTQAKHWLYQVNINQLTCYLCLKAFLIYQEFVNSPDLGKQEGSRILKISNVAKQQ